MGYYGDQLSQAESISLTASPLLWEWAGEQSFIPTPQPPHGSLARAVHLSTHLPRMGCDDGYDDG